MTRRSWLAGVLLLGATTLVAVAPVSGQSPSAVPAGSADPAASPVASTQPSFADVQIVSGIKSFSKAYAYGAATGPDGSVVMVGEHIGKDPAVPARAAAWRTTDGLDWAEVKLPRSNRARSFGVAASSLGWAAVGVVPSGPGLIWTSIDGLTWVRAKSLAGGAPQTITPTLDGFLAGGQSIIAGVNRPVLWRSTGLTSWKAIRLPGKGLVTALAQLPDGVTLALIQSVSAKQGTTQIDYRYARSVDGTTWDLVDFPDPSTDTEVLNAAEMGVQRDHFIQVVDGGPAGGPFVGSVRTSPDGLVWQDATVATGPLFAVASGPVVNIFAQGVQVASADGIQWTMVARPENGVTFGATALPDGRSVVINNSFGATPSVVVVIVPAVAEPALTAPDPSPPMVAPVPSPSASPSP